MQIPFNKPAHIGKELEYIQNVIENKHLSGNGSYTKQCQRWLKSLTHSQHVLLTHSCTAALEMAALLIDVQPGDEIIMPSYTFVSTANAFVLRGGVPVFVDIRADTLNLDETKIEAAITHKTKAIVPVHYAGVSCEMDVIMAIAKKYNLFVIEDAAQGLMSTYKNRPLGSIGHLAAFSFHETKNIISGEGGALIINDSQFVERAEIIWEKGTDRSKFFRGQVDKYTWVDLGSSYLPSDILAAYLWAQFENAEEITARRIKIWESYHYALLQFAKDESLILPTIPRHCQHNAHMYYVLLANEEMRVRLISFLKENGIATAFHYFPLHLAPMGKKCGSVSGALTVTEDIYSRLLRLPLWLGVEEKLADVIEKIKLGMNLCRDTA